MPFVNLICQYLFILNFKQSTVVCDMKHETDRHENCAALFVLGSTIEFLGIMTTLMSMHTFFLLLWYTLYTCGLCHTSNLINSGPHYSINTKGIQQA